MSLGTWPSEEWRTVFPPYEVSSYGRVRNASTGLVLRPSSDSGGYLGVCLCGGLARRHKIHNLVAHAFIGKRPVGLDVNHIDGNKRNNSVENLEYMSRSDNLRHAFSIGLKSHSGGKHPRCKYSQEQAAEVRSYLSQGCKHRDVSTFMRVPMHFVADVSTGRNWPTI